MPFITPPEEYEFSYDKSVSSPLKCLRNSYGEVRRIKENIRPLQGFALVNKTLIKSNNKRKFIYTMRHGKARHNAMSKEYTKPISWRFFPKLIDNFDPSLTPEGVRDAQHAGQLLRELILEEDAPRPVIVYTSPLRRCIQTAMYAIGALQLDQRVTLCVKEGLREWKGYDHNHQSDRRNTTPHILALFNDLQQQLNIDVEIELDGKQDNEDDPIMRETYVDVDRRVRQVLDDIFNDDDSSCSLLVLHNRSNKSVLRVMGHAHEEVHRLDKENCAILGYLTERTPLDPLAAQRRYETEEENWHGDKLLALEEKQDRYEQAAEDIKQYRQHNMLKLRSLKNYLVLRTLQWDEEAFKALLDLYQLAPELRMVASETVKLIDRAT